MNVICCRGMKTLNTLGSKLFIGKTQVLPKMDITYITATWVDFRFGGIPWHTWALGTLAMILWYQYGTEFERWGTCALLRALLCCVWLESEESRTCVESKPWLIAMNKRFENDTNISFLMENCIYSRMLCRMIRWIALNCKVPLLPWE